MAQRSIQRKINNITSISEENVEKLKELVQIWRETYKISMENAEKIFVQLIFFLLFFLLINSAEVTKASLFGLEFKSLSLPYALLYFLSAITFYRFTSILCFAQVVEEGIRSAYTKLFTDFQYSGLTDLGGYPSIPQIETCFANLEDESSSFFVKYIGNIFVVGQSVILVLAVLILLVLNSYFLLRSTLVSDSWAILLICISWFFILRSLILLVQMFRHYN